MSDQTKASDIGDTVGVELEHRFAGGAIELQHRFAGRFDIGFARDAAFQCGRNHAGTDPLCQHQGVAGAGACVGLDALGMDGSGDGVAELDLVVGDAVASQNGALGFAHLVGSAANDSFQRLEIAFGRICEDGQRRDGPASHGIDIAERIGGGDGSEGVGIVHDGREEVDGLNQGTLRRELVHAGVVRRVKPDQNVTVRPARYAPKHVVQNLWTQLRRSTGCTGVGS